MPVETKFAISIETCDGKKQSLPLADGPIIFDVAKGAAASHGLDANTQQSKPPEQGLGAMAADTPPAHAGLGASPDGLNMDATEPDPKKKKLNPLIQRVDTALTRVDTALQTMDADEAEKREKRKKQRAEEQEKKEEDEERYNQKIGSLWTHGQMLPLEVRRLLISAQKNYNPGPASNWMVMF